MRFVCDSAAETCTPLTSESTDFSNTLLTQLNDAFGDQFLSQFIKITPAGREASRRLAHSSSEIWIM